MAWTKLVVVLIRARREVKATIVPKLCCRAREMKTRWLLPNKGPGDSNDLCGLESGDRSWSRWEEVGEGIDHSSPAHHPLISHSSSVQIGEEDPSHSPSVTFIMRHHVLVHLAHTAHQPHLPISDKWIQNFGASLGR
jgi:hypothetical protein